MNVCSHTNKFCNSSSEVKFLTENGHFEFLSPTLGLRAIYAVHLRLNEKLVVLVDFRFVLIELFSLGVMAEALQANVD